MDHDGVYAFVNCNKKCQMKMKRFVEVSFLFSFPYMHRDYNLYYYIFLLCALYNVFNLGHMYNFKQYTRYC